MLRRGGGGRSRLLLRRGAVALLPGAVALLAAVEPVGLQRVVQRCTTVARAGRRRQRLRLLAGGPLLRTRRGRRPRGTEVALVAARLRALELPGAAGVRATGQRVLAGGAAVVARRGELAVELPSYPYAWGLANWPVLAGLLGLFWPFCPFEGPKTSERTNWPVFCEPFVPGCGAPKSCWAYWPVFCGESAPGRPYWPVCCGLPGAGTPKSGRGKSEAVPWENSVGEPGP